MYTKARLQAASRSVNNRHCRKPAKNCLRLFTIRSIGARKLRHFATIFTLSSRSTQLLTKLATLVIQQKPCSPISKPLAALKAKLANSKRATRKTNGCVQAALCVILRARVCRISPALRDAVYCAGVIEKNDTNRHYLQEYAERVGRQVTTYLYLFDEQRSWSRTLRCQEP